MRRKKRRRKKRRKRRIVSQAPPFFLLAGGAWPCFVSKLEDAPLLELPRTIQPFGN
jgi:hypothetical protein